MRTALVTGAARGLGSLAAKRLAAAARDGHVHAGRRVTRLLPTMNVRRTA